MNKFLILSTPRSGSHFLLSSIQNYYENMIDLDEIIHEKRDGILDRDLAITSFVSELLRDNAISIIHQYQIRYWNIDFDFFSNIINNNNIKVIMLIRTNKLNKYLSIKLAQENNLFHTNQEFYEHPKKIEYSSEEFKRFLNEEKRLNQELFEVASFLNKVKIVYYEELLMFGGFFFENYFIKNSNNRFNKLVKESNIKKYVEFESKEEENSFDSFLEIFNKSLPY